MRNVTVVIRQSSNTTTAVLTWQQPEEPNGVIIEYQVFYAGYEPSSGPGLQVYDYFVQSTQLVTLKSTLHMHACRVGSSGMECVCIVAECITVFTAKFHDPSSKIDFDIHFPK